LLLAKDNEGRAVFHMAVRHRQLEECQEIFNWAKENLTREEVNKLLLTTDNDGRTVFHMEIKYRN
jgi:endo-1,4-beta-D-glucanase Y